MESNKHNDELIKRKLADLNAEPRKLNFATVHANYEKAKQTSSNKWGLFSFVGGIAIAIIVTTYVLLNQHSEPIVAQANANSSGSVEVTHSSNSANITSVGTSTQDKFVERSVESTSNDRASSNNTNPDKNVSANAANISNAHESATEKNSANQPSTKLVNEEVYKNLAVGKELNNSLKGLAKNRTSNSKNSLNSKEKSSGKKTEPLENSVLTNSTKYKIGESLVKNTTKKQAQNTPAGNGKDHAKETQPFSNTNVKYKAEDQFTNNQIASRGAEVKNSATELEKNETPENHTGNTNPSATTQQGLGDQNNNSVANNAYFEGKNESSTHQITKTDSVSNNAAITNKVDTANTAGHIPGVIGTGSVSPRNKHKWLIGAEASYNVITYNSKENTSAPSQFTTGDPAFSTAYANAVGKGKHQLITGAITLGYLHNEQIGITTGLSYFNIKNTFSVGTTSSPIYTTAVDYYVWNYVPDTSNTLTLKIVDTVYKQVPTGKYTTAGTTVNGDSVSTANFENNIRYLSIPFNLSYNFKIGAKLCIEPQAGLIYTLPLKSSHLTATDAYKFDYNKQKTDLRKNLYFNTALKVGYNISNKMQVYVRGGYFFRNQSIYNADQPINLSLKSIYTSFGITFRVK